MRNPWQMKSDGHHWNIYILDLETNGDQDFWKSKLNP